MNNEKQQQIEIGSVYIWKGCQPNEVNYNKLFTITNITKTQVIYYCFNSSRRWKRNIGIWQKWIDSGRMINIGSAQLGKVLFQ